MAEVHVVIASALCSRQSQETMVALLGAVTRPRVVGRAPWASQECGQDIYPSTKTNVLNDERQVQLEAWIAASWHPERALVALVHMPHPFETDQPRMLACTGRFQLSRECIKALDQHAAQSGLTRSRNGPTAQLIANGTRELGMERIENYIKHFASCLPDALFRITVDRRRLRVTIASDACDTHLVGWLVTRLLPDDHGIRAYREDDADWHPPKAPYELRLRIGGESGVELVTEVVRLSRAVGGGVAVRLTSPKQFVAGDD